MTAGARTPEELDTLLEDAFVLRDGAALERLFDASALLLDVRSGMEARGGAAIDRVIARLWAGGATYVAGPRRVLQVRDTALVVGDAAIHVVRRDSDGAWRAAIALLEIDTQPRSEEP